MNNDNPALKENNSETSNIVSIYTEEPKASSLKFLGIEPVLLGRILRLGWPVILGMLTQTAINTIDLIMVGRLNDEIAVPAAAAIMVSVVLLWGFGGFLSAISVGTQALCARRYSEGYQDKAGQVLFNSILVSLLASLVVTAIALYSLPATVTFLSSDSEVRHIGIEYSKIRLLGLPSMALMASYKSFYDGMGFVKVHMVIAILMNILNIIFNYVFIFGFESTFFSVAALGPYGAALGSVIASYFGVFFMIICSLRANDRRRYQIYRWENINGNVAKAIAKLSIWSGLATVILMLGVALFNYIVSSIDANNHTGSINSSAASIIIHVMMLVFMTCLAFGTSTATLVAQSIGAKKAYLAKRYAKNCVLLAVYIMGLFGIFTFLFPKPILLLFLPTDLDSNALKEQVIEAAIPSLRLAALLLSPTAAAGMVLTQALYGAGETKYVMIVEFILHFLCLVPLAYFLAIYLGYGLLGCWIAAIIYGVGLTIATGIRFAQGHWMKIRL